MAAFKYSNLFIFALVLSLAVVSFAQKVDEEPEDEAELDELEDTPEQEDEEIPSTPCSSDKPDDCPYKINAQGIFKWVKNSTDYEWIFIAFCITLGCCIFIVVIAAAIYSNRMFKKKAAFEARHVIEEDERARALLRSERIGSHTAQPRRESLSVPIEDPAFKYHHHD